MSYQVFGCPQATAVVPLLPNWQEATTTIRGPFECVHLHGGRVTPSLCGLLYGLRGVLTDIPIVVTGRTKDLPAVLKHLGYQQLQVKPLPVWATSTWVELEPGKSCKTPWSDLLDNTFASRVLDILSTEPDFIDQALDAKVHVTVFSEDLRLWRHIWRRVQKELRCTSTTA